MLHIRPESSAGGERQALAADYMGGAGRTGLILRRRATNRPAFTGFPTFENGSYEPNIQTAWETLRLLACGGEPKPGRKGAEWNREAPQNRSALDIRIIQLIEPATFGL
jgi:hypothetical protein